MTWKKLWSAERHAQRPGDGAEFLGRIDLDSGEGDRTACLALDELGALLLEHLEGVASTREGVKVVWGARVCGVGEEEEDGGRAWVDVEVGEEKRTERHYADYVVGCDGASSAVRRLLFGEKTFPGRTWDEQIVAANVSRSNIFRGKEMWTGKRRHEEGQLSTTPKS